MSELENIAENWRREALRVTDVAISYQTRLAAAERELDKLRAEDSARGKANARLNRRNQELEGAIRYYLAHHEDGGYESRTQALAKIKKILDKPL